MAKSIAIDGPAGAGKSTIAKMVAGKLGFIYVDTGAMYRAMALFLLRSGISRDDTASIEKACNDADISISYVDGKQVVLLGGENVNDHLRTEEVGNMASESSMVSTLLPSIFNTDTLAIVKFLLSDLILMP